MPPKPKVTLEEVASAVFDDKGNQIRSYQEAANFLTEQKGVEIAKQTVASALRRAALAVNANLDMSGFLPANMAADHGGEKEATALRALAEIAAGREISPARQEAAERFRAMSGEYICAYDPEYGFYWERRTPGDERWLFE